MSIKLTGLSLAELKGLQARVEAAIDKHEATNLAKARAELTKLAKEFGVAVQDLVGDDNVPKSPRKRGFARAQRYPPSTGAQKIHHSRGLDAA